MGRGKAYVVFRGRQTGVFMCWEECHRQTVAFKGNSFKSYETFEQAVEAWNNYKSKAPTDEDNSEEPSKRPSPPPMPQARWLVKR